MTVTHAQGSDDDVEVVEARFCCGAPVVDELDGLNVEVAVDEVVEVEEVGIVDEVELDVEVVGSVVDVDVDVVEVDVDVVGSVVDVDVVEVDVVVEVEVGPAV
jgi:hypothetical protein